MTIFFLSEPYTFFTIALSLLSPPLIIPKTLTLVATADIDGDGRGATKEWEEAKGLGLGFEGDG